jgi:hypothetical protein
MESSIITDITSSANLGKENAPEGQGTEDQYRGVLLILV